MAGLNGYSEACERAAYIDRSDRLRIEFTGSQVADTLNGLLTNDIAALAPWSGCYAAALTAKGKVIADVRVFAREGSYLVDAPAAAAAGLLAMLRKFVNPRLAKFRDVSGELCDIGVFGPNAARIVTALAGPGESALNAMRPFACSTGGADGANVLVARAPDLGVAGFDIVAPRESFGALAERIGSEGAVPLTPEAAEALRIEAGWPLFGADMDENHLAQEAGLDRLGAISFNKGCYTGQETVARVHFRGHVNRTLRGLKAVAPLTSGAVVKDAAGGVVGAVQSAAQSPRLGPIALAYVRREVADGATVTVGDDGATATVSGLPFVP